MNHIATYLRDIFFNKKTGRLIYRRKEVLKYFFFDKGAIVQVKTNQPDERLGEILFKLERIPKEAHAKIDEFIEPGKSIGEVLTTQGVISEDDLAEALGHQIRESILNVFAVFDAEIDFQPLAEIAAGATESRVSVPLLIEYGIRRMQTNPLLQAFLAGRTPILGRKTYAYLLTVEEREILEKVNGKETAEIILRGLTIPGDQFWKSLYLFYCLGVVDFQGEAQGPAAGPEDPPQRRGDADRRPPGDRRGPGLPRDPAGDDALPDPGHPQDGHGRGRQEGLFPDGPPLPPRPVRPQDRRRVQGPDRRGLRRHHQRLPGPEQQGLPADLRRQVRPGLDPGRHPGNVSRRPTSSSARARPFTPRDATTRPSPTSRRPSGCAGTRAITSFSWRCANRS